MQGRGELRRELSRALRTGLACRRPQRRPEQRRNRYATPMIMISERPAEVADRAVPGHWEGDLLMGAANRSAIGTLVERTTRYVVLLPLPHGHAAEQVRDALLAAVAALPTHLLQSLTWDQGVEMGRHAEFVTASGMPVYFCAPGSPWQRGSNENTNGLLRQYFPKGTDLRVHAPSTWPPSPPSSTVALARLSLGRPPPSASLVFSYQPANQHRCNDRRNPPDKAEALQGRAVIAARPTGTALHRRRPGRDQRLDQDPPLIADQPRRGRRRRHATACVRLPRTRHIPSLDICNDF